MKEKGREPEEEIWRCRSSRESGRERNQERVRMCQSACASRHCAVWCGPDFVQVLRGRQHCLCQSGVGVFLLA